MMKQNSGSFLILLLLSNRHLSLSENTSARSKTFSLRKDRILLPPCPMGIKIKKIYDHLLFTKKPLSSPIQETFSLSMGKNVLQPFALDLHLSQPRKIVKLFSKNKNIALFDSDKLGQSHNKDLHEWRYIHASGNERQNEVKRFFYIIKDSKRREENYSPSSLR